MSFDFTKIDKYHTLYTKACIDGKKYVEEFLRNYEYDNTKVDMVDCTYIILKGKKLTESQIKMFEGSMSVRLVRTEYYCNSSYGERTSYYEYYFLI